MLPAGCSRRLVTELQNALDYCAERQRQLDRSMRVSRRLLQAWEPAETAALEPTLAPETNEEAPSPVYTPSPQDLKELELLTQALEKAVHVRKGIVKAGEGHKAASVAVSANTASAPSWASETKPPKGIRQTTGPAKGLPERRLPSVAHRTCMKRGAQAAKTGPDLRDQQMAPLVAPPAAEGFTLKEKGTLLRLPMAFRKAVSQNSRLWAQLSATQTSDSMDAAAASKTQFLQKMQTTVSLLSLLEQRVVVSGSKPGLPSSGLSAAEVEAEVGSLWKACSLLRQRMETELTADITDCMQEYRCLLTLEGLQAIVGQCLHTLQELRAVVIEQHLELWPERRFPRTSLPCGGGADPIWSPQLLLYSSTQELQTLAALKLEVAMLDQQIHLEKVLMAELLPLVSTQEPLGLCRAVHSLLCEGGERILTILRDEPAD